MTLEELYEQIGGDYQEAIARLRMEKLISKFIVRFLDDPSCANLFAAYDAGDEAAMFDAAHTAKGVCANLSLTSLLEPVSAITEAVRPGNEHLKAETDLDGLMQELKAAHGKAVEAISVYAAQ